MVLFTHNVRKIKGATHKSGDVDVTCKGGLKILTAMFDKLDMTMTCLQWDLFCIFLFVVKGVHCVLKNKGHVRQLYVVQQCTLLIANCVAKNNAINSFLFFFLGALCVFLFSCCWTDCVCKVHDASHNLNCNITKKIKQALNKESWHTVCNDPGTVRVSGRRGRLRL